MNINFEIDLELIFAILKILKVRFKPCGKIKLNPISNIIS